MRPEIALLLLGMALAAGGCDRTSTPPEQANATAAATDQTVPEGDGTVPDVEDTPATPAQSTAGALDRSHKGEAAPTDTFLDPHGKPVTLADFRGKPVLLNLWATWCAPCVKEMPTLDTLAGKLDGKVQVLAVSQDLEGAAKVVPWFETRTFARLKPYLDSDAGLSTTLGINLPTTILYDAQGKELWRTSGEMDWTGAKAAALVAEAG